MVYLENPRRIGSGVLIEVWVFSSLYSLSIKSGGTECKGWIWIHGALKSISGKPVFLLFIFICRRFHQVIGCCRYFVNQAGKGTVTLLTGPGTYGGLSKGPRRGAQVSGIQVTPEAVEMARSCGINVESLRVFSTMSVHTKAMLHGKTWTLCQGCNSFVPVKPTQIWVSCYSNMET